MQIHVWVIAVALATLACAGQDVAEDSSPYRLAVAIAPSGQVTAGSKAMLERAIRGGSPVRVGFGIDFDNDGRMEVEHWADAHFLSFYQGEVFTQLAPIQEQQPQSNAPEIHFGQAAHPWTGMLDTTGRLRSWFPDKAPSEMRVASWWYVLGR